MKKKIIITILLCLSTTLGLQAQEYHLGQVVTNPDGSQGVVFYLNEDCTSGWMVALHDAASNIPWGLTEEIEGLNHVINTNNDILTSAFADTDGYSNTLAILKHNQFYWAFVADDSWFKKMAYVWCRQEFEVAYGSYGEIASMTGSD